MAAAAAAAAAEETWTVVLVVMSVIVSVLASQTSTLGDPCVSTSWFELNALGRWSSSASALGTLTAEYPNGRHPPAVTDLPWATVRERARDLGRKFGYGLPLPVTTCPTPSSVCPSTLSAPYASCTRTVQRALCVTVDDVCKALLVTVEEPERCCCWLEERNSTRTTGEIKRVLLRNLCPLMQGGKLVISSEESATLPSAHKTPRDFEILAPHDNTTRDGKSESEESDSDELTEESIAETSVLEDVIAAVVFLFIGFVLLLVRSRVFRFTRKKREEEIKDAESQETLVDETII